MWTRTFSHDWYVDSLCFTTISITWTLEAAAEDRSDQVGITMIIDTGPKSAGGFYVMNIIDGTRTVEFRSSRLGPCLLVDDDVCVPQSYNKEKAFIVLSTVKGWQAASRDDLMLQLN